MACIYDNIFFSSQADARSIFGFVGSLVTAVAMTMWFRATRQRDLGVHSPWASTSYLVSAGSRDRWWQANTILMPIILKQTSCRCVLKEKWSREIWGGEISKTSSISQEKVDLGSGGLGKWLLIIVTSYHLLSSYQVVETVQKEIRQGYTWIYIRIQLQIQTDNDISPPQKTQALCSPATAGGHDLRSKFQLPKVNRNFNLYWHLSKSMTMMEYKTHSKISQNSLSFPLLPHLAANVRSSYLANIPECSLVLSFRVSAAAFSCPARGLHQAGGFNLSGGRSAFSSAGLSCRFSTPGAPPTGRTISLPPTSAELSFFPFVSLFF